MMRKHIGIKHNIDKTEENSSNALYGYQVLLAEDDYEMRMLLAWSLNKQGYHVTECKDGNSLMKKVGSMPYESAQLFDLIISDIRMPGFTGLQVLESIRDYEGLPPILLITAFPNDETHKKARQLGALAVFEKPFEVDALVEKVRQILPPGLAEKRLSQKQVLQPGAPLPFPLNITFRKGMGVESIFAFIRSMAAKLNRFADHIKKVHVVVENLSPETYRKYRYHISVKVVIKGYKPIIVSHKTDDADRYENLYLGISIAFAMARSQLKHKLGKRRAKRFTQRRPRRQEIVDECE
jgi:CheY-like chemotaxis protein